MVMNTTSVLYMDINNHTGNNLYSFNRQILLERWKRYFCQPFWSCWWVMKMWKMVTHVGVDVAICYTHTFILQKQLRIWKVIIIRLLNVMINCTIYWNDEYIVNDYCILTFNWYHTLPHWILKPQIICHCID